MSRTVVFVHGVGVRGEAYAKTFAAVKGGFTQGAEGVTVRGCYWGDAEGARLNAQGASIPKYHQSGGRHPLFQEEQLSLWAVLYTDPWYELRLIRHFRSSVLADVPPGHLSPLQELLDQMDRFAPSPSLGQLLAQRGLNTYFDEAVEALRNSPELQKIHSAGSDAVFELRRAIARGLLAYTIAAAEEAGELPVDGRTRDDELMLRLGSELRTEGRGLSSLITAVPRRVASGAAVRRRGLLSDRGMATSGDVLRYQVHGEGLRRLIRNVVEDAPGDAVTLVGHSLGGVACFDLLVLDQIPRVDRLLTVGSQAPYLYEIGALASLSYPSPLPLHFPEDWLNVYDPNDLLAYVGRELFGDRVRDSQIDNRQPFPQAHSAYWNNDDFWKVVSPWAR